MARVTGERGFETSEDCLYLDVWTPACDDRRRPVMVWIHGGGVVLGWGSDPTHDGAVLCKRGDVVLVNVGYRLGALGVLAHPELTDPETGCTGNWNLQDQMAALRWVQREIEAFGGDPDRVTIFGESAGGMSVGALLGMPSAKGLFHRAISQSGGASANEMDVMVSYTERLVADLNCKVGDLRTVPADELVAAQVRTDLFGLTQRGGGFTVDGTLLPQPPLEGIRSGANRGVPLVAGITKDEAKIGLGWRRGETPQIDETRLQRHVTTMLGDEEAARHTIDAFRRARSERGEPVTPTEIVFAIETELGFRRLSLDLIEAQLSHTADVFSYVFTWESKAMGGVMGSPHGIDVPFTFGALNGPGRFTGPIEAEDRRVAERMQDAWCAFAATGDPSHPSVGPWPRYDLTRRATMLIGLQMEVTDAPNETERRSWAENPATASAG